MLTWRYLQKNHWPDLQYKRTCPRYEHDMKENLLNFLNKTTVDNIL